MSSSVNNKDIQRYLPNKVTSNKKKQGLMSPEATTQKRFKNIKLLQSKMEELKQEPMQDYMMHQQQLLQQTDKLHSIQKQKHHRPKPLKLDQEQFIMMENNYLRGSVTGKYIQSSPLHMTGQAEAEINQAFQSRKNESPSHVSEEFLRDKLEFFNKRLKDSHSQLPKERMIQTQQNQRTKTLANNQSASKFDINQYSSGNLQKLIRESRGQNNGQQYFKNQRNSNAPIKYDQNGRKSKSKLRNTTDRQTQDTGELIENHYQKLQQSYNEIFQSQNDYRNNMINQQLLSAQRQSSQGRYLEVNSSLPDIRSKKKVITNRMSDENTQSQSTNQQHANGQNNNNFQNNINNSIILLQAPPIGFLSPQAQSNSDFRFFQQQPGAQIPTQRNNSRGRIDPMRRSKNRFPQEEFNSPQHFRSKKSVSPEIQNQRQNLTNIPQVGRRRSDANLSGNSNNMRSMSAGDKVSSNDPESIERQNNQMLMQILYNNLKKTQGRTKQKKKHYQKFAPSGSSDKGKMGAAYKTASQSQRGFTKLSNRIHTPLERKIQIMSQRSNKSRSEFGGSQDSNKKITNFSSYVKNKLIQSDVKSMSHHRESPNSSQIVGRAISNSWVVKSDQELLAISQLVDSRKNTIKQVNHGGSKQASNVTEEQSLQEASQKIESLLKQNTMFNDINCEQITSTMMQLLADEQKNGKRKKVAFKKEVKKDLSTNQVNKSLENSSKSREGTPGKKTTVRKDIISRSQEIAKKSRDVAKDMIKKEDKLKEEMQKKEAKRKIKEESIRKSKEEQIRKFKEEAQRKAKEESQRKQKEEAVSKMRVDTHRDTLRKPKQKLKMPEISLKTNSLKQLKDQGSDIEPQGSIIPKNLGEKRKSALSAKQKDAPATDQKKSSNDSEANTVNTAQFPAASESQKKLVMVSQQSPISQNLMVKSQSFMDEIETKMLPPQVSKFVNIQEESRNYNSSAQTNSYNVQGEFQDFGCQSKIEFGEEQIDSIQIVDDDNQVGGQDSPILDQDNTPIAINKPSPIKHDEVIAERVVETPTPIVLLVRRQPSPPPITPTVLIAIQEENSSESQVKKAETPAPRTPTPPIIASPSTPPRAVSKPKQKVKQSKSPVHKKPNKFTQFLLNQIEQAQIGDKVLHSYSEKPQLTNLASSSLKPSSQNLGLMKQPQFKPKDLFNQTYKIPVSEKKEEKNKKQPLKVTPEVKQEEKQDTALNLVDSKMFDFASQKDPQSVDHIAGFTQITDECQLYNQLKSQMDEFYTTSKQKYHLNLRKIQTEKKLMSLSLGKMKLGSSTSDKETQLLVQMKDQIQTECQQINSNLTIFKLDPNSFIEKFQQEINQENQQDASPRDSNNNLLKKTSFVESSSSHLRNDLALSKQFSTHVEKEPNSGRSSRNPPTPDSKSGRISRNSSNNNEQSQMLSDSKELQYMYSDSLRSTGSTVSQTRKKIITTILPQHLIKFYEDEVTLQLQLKMFLSPANQNTTPRSNNEKKLASRILKKMNTNGMLMVNTKKQHKYQQFHDDKLHIDDLLKAYYEEQFSIQYPGVDPYAKDEYKATISDCTSDTESQLLGSTISTFSQFSTQSIQSGIGFEFNIPLSLQQINRQRSNSLQDMFKYAQISKDKENDYSPPYKNLGVGDIYINEGNIEVDDSSISHSRGIVNIKSVISLNTNTYQDSIQDNSDYHQQYQNYIQQTKGYDSCPNYQILQKVGESDRLPNSQERETNVAPDHIDKPFFFNEHSLATFKYEKVLLFDLNQTLDQYDIKSVNFFLNKINEIWMSKAKKSINAKKSVTQADLSKVQGKYRKQVRMLQKQKYSETSNLQVLSRFKLIHQINEMIFATQDYRQWQIQRLNGYDSNIIKEKSKILETWNNDNFWGGNQLLLKKFLQKNQVNIETASISSDCDGVEYNNTDCIQMMHEGINPSLLLKNVVKDKNMQYEIFQIMSQTKLQKLKNKIINDQTILITDRIAMIDQRFKWIQNLAATKYMKARGLDKCPDEFMEVLGQSEYSSEFSSDDQIEQTANYFFVEDHVLQSQKRKYINERAGNHTRVAAQSVDKCRSSQSSQKATFSFGFRYGNQPRKNKSVTKKSPVKIGRVASPLINFQETKQEVGHVILLNGCTLSLADESNVTDRFGSKLNFSQKAKAREDINRIQTYYDHVKDHLKNKSKQDKIIIKYKRKQLLREDQIDQDNQTALKQFLTHKISRIVHTKKNKQAIHFDLTVSTVKRYTNPFEMSRFVKQANISNLMNRFRKPVKKEKQVHIKTQKFFTADSNQADGVEDFHKSPDYKQGNKCDNFVFKCKLQSIGDFADLKRLETEVTLSNQYPKDVLQYKHIIDPDSGYPIYMLFEVLHVHRKTIRDVQEDQAKALKVIKDLTNNQECNKISLLVEKMKQKQSNNINNVEL